MKNSFIFQPPGPDFRMSPLNPDYERAGSLLRASFAFRTFRPASATEPVQHPGSSAGALSILHVTAVALQLFLKHLTGPPSRGLPRAFPPGFPAAVRPPRQALPNGRCQLNKGPPGPSPGDVSPQPCPPGPGTRMDGAMSAVRLCSLRSRPPTSGARSPRNVSVLQREACPARTPVATETLRSGSGSGSGLASAGCPVQLLPASFIP